MKKRLFLILSVSIMLFAGCGNKGITTDREMEKTETAGGTEETDMAGDEEIPAAVQTEDGETEKAQAETEAPEETEPEEEREEVETSAPQPVSQPEPKGETEPSQGSTDVPEPEEMKPEAKPVEREPECEAKPEERGPECEAEPEEAEPEGTEQQEQAVEQTAAAYDPVSVCRQAVAKCQAGGMTTTTDNLVSLLAEGKITQEEYDSYYPYDGLGYYSVFVETDLNKASTTSGRKLGSEDGIADYIAGMMLLETEPVFYIEYAGVYSLNGTDFYEFRCYR